MTVNSHGKPVVVYGASGYTGRLVCEYLREYNLPFVAAGRSEEKLSSSMTTNVAGIETADYGVVAVEHDVGFLLRDEDFDLGTGLSFELGYSASVMGAESAARAALRIVLAGHLGTHPGDVEFDAALRIDTPGEAEYYRHGGIMQYVLRTLLA